MNDKFMWTYLIHLSTHFWGDESSPAEGWYGQKPWNDNNNVDIAVWDGTVKYLAETGFNTLIIDLGDAIQYETHPEICAPDAWSKEFLKKKLDEMRALGITPIPKLNFSTTHDGWMKMYHRMVSTPAYYAFCADVIGEVCELFESPELLHLGMDEEGLQLTGRDLSVCRNGELWWHDFNFLAKECEKHGARPWIWSDRMFTNTDEFFAKMSKSVLQSYWYYARFQDYPAGHDYNRLLTGYALLEEHGYDQVPTASCYSNNYTTRETLAHGKKIITPELLKGYMTAPWKMTHTAMRYDLLKEAEIFYHARKEFYPETL